MLSIIDVLILTTYLGGRTLWKLTATEQHSDVADLREFSQACSAQSPAAGLSTLSGLQYVIAGTVLCAR